MNTSTPVTATRGTPAVPRPRVPLALRVLNAVACTAETLGLRAATDEHTLCAAASRRTGLSDFGDDRFRLGIRQFSQGPDVADKLGCFVRVLTRFVALRSLCNRLVIEQEIKEHPEILQVTVPRPIVVVGMMRTGTTLLQNLLAQDPASRSLLIWEAMSPATPRLARGGRDPRRRRAERVVWLLKHAYPRLAALHTFEANGPQECGPLFRPTFLLPIFGKDFRPWLDELPPDRVEWAYREYHRQLQLLQWQRPAPGHWILKWPGHMIALGTLLQTVPEAVVVQTHRDPCRVIPSFCQLVAHLAFFYSDERMQALPSELVAITADLLGRAAEARSRIPSHRILDVHYQQLMADPMGVLRRIYDHFGYPYTGEFERRARQWLEEHPRRERATGYYELEQFGLDRASVEKAFAAYCEQYRVEPER